MLRSVSKAVTKTNNEISNPVLPTRSMSHISGQNVKSPSPESVRLNSPSTMARKQHYEVQETRCKDITRQEPKDCKDKSCSMVCNETGNKETIGHLTSSSKIPSDEVFDKTPTFLSEDSNAKGQQKDQYIMIYQKPHDASLTESQMDPQITSYLNKDDINQKIRKTKNISYYDQE